MRKTLLLLIAAAAVSLASAQPRVQLGARAGVASRDMELVAGDFDNTHYDTESRMGFHLAAVSRIRLAELGGGPLGVGLFVQPEIVYSQNNYKISKDRGAVSTIRMQSVEVPLLLSLKVSIVRLQAGPVFVAMYKNTTVKGEVEITPVKLPLAGYAVGASVEIIGGLVLDGRFGGQFKKIDNDIKAGESVRDAVRGSLSNWSLGLSMLF